MWYYILPLVHPSSSSMKLLTPEETLYLGSLDMCLRFLVRGTTKIRRKSYIWHKCEYWCRCQINVKLQSSQKRRMVLFFSWLRLGYITGLHRYLTIPWSQSCGTKSGYLSIVGWGKNYLPRIVNVFDNDNLTKNHGRIFG